MEGNKADTIWCGNCDFQSLFKDVIHHLFKDHANSVLKFRETCVNEGGKCFLVSKVIDIPTHVKYEDIKVNIDSQQHSVQKSVTCSLCQIVTKFV